MAYVTFFGIDPGLVHTGVVMIRVDETLNMHRVEHQVFDGVDPKEIAEWINHRDLTRQARIYVEKYLDRGTVFREHGPMREAETLLMQTLRRGTLVNNTGAKKIVTDGLMKLLDVWKFPTTNHRDLQAAARIALYGALKDPTLNPIISRLVTKLLGKEPA